MQTNGFHPSSPMSAPVNATIGGKGDLICRATGWSDVAKFFLLNYGLHALTVISPPGSTFLQTVVIALTAVLLPFSGIVRAGIVIYDYPRGEKNPLEIALKAGALCTVMESKYVKQAELELISPLLTNIHGQHPAGPTSVIHDKHIHDVESQVSADSQVHYSLVRVPRDSTVAETIETTNSDASQPQTDCAYLWEAVTTNILTRLSYFREVVTTNTSKYPPQQQLACNYSILRASAAIIQIIYGSIELYKVGGRQIDRFGYAAYSFTVIPYVLMSLTNLIANFCTPQYPSMFLVLNKPRREISNTLVGSTRLGTETDGQQSEPKTAGSVMGEQNQRPGPGAVGSAAGEGQAGEKVEAEISGAVGIATKIPTGKRGIQGLGLYWSGIRSLGWYGFILAVLGLCLFGAGPYIIIQLLTGFRNGQSTWSQRAWMMAWLALGQYIGPPLTFASQWTPKQNREPVEKQCRVLCCALVSSIPTLGGFVVAAKMMFEGEVCVTI